MAMMISGANYGRLTALQKSNIFLWRLTHNTLALKRNLQRRGMKIDAKCGICGRFGEDGGHIFLKCKEVKRIWRELNLEEVRVDLLLAV